MDYVTTDGTRSPLSPPVSGTTWSGLNWGGIPYEWMAEFFGGYYNGTYHTNDWPSAGTLLDSGGPTLLQVFLSGGNPFDSSTWLQTALTKTQEGLFLSWNTQPGFTYQVQVTTNFTAWSNVGAPRFAAGASDSIYVGGGSAGYYRVLLLRQMKFCMRQTIKRFLWVVGLVFGLQSAWAFSLLGPVGNGGDAWQVTINGYNPLGVRRGAAVFR